MTYINQIRTLPARELKTILQYTVSISPAKLPMHGNRGVNADSSEIVVTHSRHSCDFSYELPWFRSYFCVLNWFRSLQRFKILEIEDLVEVGVLRRVEPEHRNGPLALG
jgi:hypothetical protein